MWKNRDVGKCPCYPTKELLQTLDKVVDMIEELGQEYLAFDTSELYKDVDKVMENAGYKKIGEGLTRLIYEFKDENNCDCVVKIAKSKDARLSNFNEVAVMVDAPRDVKNVFLELGAADEEGWWVTQPKAKIPRRGERFKILDQIWDVLDKAGFDCHDLHSDNVGLYAWRPVIINYGFGLTCVKSKTFYGVRGQLKVTEKPTSMPTEFTRFATSPGEGFRVEQVKEVQ